MSHSRRRLKLGRHALGTIGATVLFAALVSPPAALAIDEATFSKGAEDPVAEIGVAADPADETSGFGFVVSPSAVAPGEAVRFTSSETSREQEVSLVFEYLSWPGQGPASTSGPDFWGRITVGTDGAHDGELAIPQAVAPGEYLIHYSCGGGDAISCAGDIPFTVLGNVPDTEPEGVVMTFTADSLQGKPGDTINVTGDCTYNGVGADSIQASWTHASTGEESLTERMGLFSLDNGGLLNQQLQVPPGAKPWNDEVFRNELLLSCDLGAVGVGLSGFEYTVQAEGDTSVVIPTENTAAPSNAPRELAATGFDQNTLVLSALGMLSLGAALSLAARVRPR